MTGKGDCRKSADINKGIWRQIERWSRREGRRESENEREFVHFHQNKVF